MSVEVVGINSLRVNLNDAVQAIIDAVGQELQWGAEDIEGRAKLIANQTKDRGQLLDSIIADTDDPLDCSVNVAAAYAPYVEFGTGPQFNANGRDEIAAQFKGPTGRPFSEMVESIKGWLHRKKYYPKGVKTEKQKTNYAQFIATKILKRGLPPRPFLFKAYDEALPEIIQNIRNI